MSEIQKALSLGSLEARVAVLALIPGSSSVKTEGSEEPGRL